MPKPRTLRRPTPTTAQQRRKGFDEEDAGTRETEKMKKYRRSREAECGGLKGLLKTLFSIASCKLTRFYFLGHFFTFYIFLRAAYLYSGLTGWK